MHEIDRASLRLGRASEGSDTEMTTAHGYSQQKDNYAKRLRRIEGQVRGIARMIEEDKYCIDVLTQISAALGDGAGDAVAQVLVKQVQRH